MNKVIILLIVSVFITLSLSRAIDQVLVANVDFAPTNFQVIKKSLAHESISFKLLLTQKNLDKLEEKFWDISNPKSANYGKFMTKKEVDELTAPSSSEVKRVVEWLKDNGIQKSEIEVFSDFIHVETTVKKVEKLFSAQFYSYMSLKTGKLRHRIAGSAYVPAHVSNIIELVLGIAEFIEDNRMDSSMRQSLTTDIPITPQYIKKFYNIPANLVATNPKNYQSVVAFTDTYSPQALQYFDKYYSISNVNVSRQGPDCLTGNASSCDQVESDLDVQYMTSIGNGVNTLFINHATGQWVLDWATSIQEFSPLPMVSSLSYGFSEIYQCLLDSSCQTMGISTAVYIERTNTQFQKLGNMGMSIFVSSGDDGAQGFYAASGNCPLDNNLYCVLGGCNYTSTECSSFIVTSDNGTVCIFPNGLGSNGCQDLLQSQQTIDAIDAFFGNNSGVAVDKDKMQNQHFYSPVECSQLTSVSYEGFTVEGYSYSESNGVLFAPDYPTSSPYVTSVGATQILNSGSEVVCSTETGAIITGGGGFSVFSNQPSYQAEAVAKYLSNFKGAPAYAYNSSNRAYPDIALVGHNFQVATPSNVESASCPCSIMPGVDGTSCSSPSLTGIISLVNDKLLNSGSTQLGFLNPLLYQAGAENPDVYNDITTGNNNCNRAYCCTFGYEAGAGYDVASGWGSINFPNFLAYAVQQKSN